MPPSSSLRAALETLARRFDRSWLDSDPLRWPRAYADPGDREVVAVVAALLAYGRVASIHASVAEVLRRLAPSPVAALAPPARTGLAARLAGFRHRFTAGEDLAWLLEGVARARDLDGSLGAYVARHAVGDEPLTAGLRAWRTLALAVPASADPVRRRARAFLFPDPDGGTALERLRMLARWCVRPDDGVDLGLWRAPGRLEPRHLVLPLDTHVHRAALDLGLTRRRVADGRAALEATLALARLDPDDPVRFDFALARPGIVGVCLHRTVPALCRPCDLRDACAKGRRLRTPGRRPTAARIASRTAG